MAVPSMGVLSQLGFAAGGTAIGSYTEAYEFLSENLTSEREIVRTDGIRGSRMHPLERIRLGRQTPGGTIVMEPTLVELANLLPRTIGANAANVYSVSDTVPVAFDVAIDRVAKVPIYAGCRCDKVTFRSSPGKPLEVSMDIEALTETIGAAGTFPTLTINATAPVIWSDCVISLAGAIQCHDMEITVDWNLKKDRFVNSITRTDLPSQDVRVMAKFTVPYDSTTIGLFDGAAGVAGVACTATFTVGGTSLLFTMSKVCFPARKSPSVSSKDEITMVLDGEAYRAGSVTPLAITLDSTP